MYPARFVTLLFAYAGVLTLVQVPLFGHGLDLQGLTRAALGATFLATAGVRARHPDEESRPGEYGAFTYLFAGLCLAYTALTFAPVVLGG